MAVKNHKLDDKIIQSAREEFLKYGYDKASLHAIVKKAHTTTGAFYTRYKSKDELFCSLVMEVFDEYRKWAPVLKEKYMSIQDSKNPEIFLEMIHQEFEIYQELLKHHYETCFLFYCRNQGSSIERMVQEMMDQKIESTVAYFQSISKADYDFDGIGLILSEQFHFFKDVLNRGYSLEKTIRCMELVEKYQEAGWKKIFDLIL